MPQLTAQLKIEAAAHSDLTVYLEFEGSADDGSVNFLTYVKTGEGAHVKVSKVQLNGENVRHVEHRYGDAGKESTIDYVSAELGGKAAIVYYKTDLMHDESNFNSQAMYLGHDDQVVDFSYWVPTQGVKTNTDILTTGALLDTSKKFFRGTIDFLRGGKKAVGRRCRCRDVGGRCGALTYLAAAESAPAPTAPSAVVPAPVLEEVLPPVAVPPPSDELVLPAPEEVPPASVPLPPPPEAPAP